MNALLRYCAAGWLLLAGLGMAVSAAAQSGGGYDLTWHTVNGGGITFATGGTYSLGATAGQPDAGNHAGAGFTLSGGFWFSGATTFTVAKDFSDNSAAVVSVSLTCTSGTVSPASALASEATPAVFTVSGFTGAPNCTAVEVVPVGYTADETGCVGVPLSTGLCTIVNTLTAGSFSVAKDFSDNSPASVTISLTCTSGAVNPPTALASESAPAIFNVTGFSGTPNCTATETVPVGYTANQAACAGVPLTTGVCTIINTQNAGTFTVAKDFSDNSPASVTVSLSCTSGTVSPLTALASEAAPAIFNVSGFSGTPNCTATETVPAGYTANQAGCSGVALATGICTIINTRNAGNFVVAKDFSDNSAATVMVSLACTSGLVTPSSALASEAAPANFTVSGFSGTPTCTATETVPVGYTADQSACTGVALSTGSCTIINAARPGTISISLSTQSTPDLQNTVFNFVAGGGLMPTTFTLSDGNVQTFSNVAPGSGYSVALQVPTDWILSSATCSDGSDPANISVSLDESIDCSFVITSTATSIPVPMLHGWGMLLLLFGITAAALVAQRRL